MIGMQPSLSLSFWFKAWNTVKPGSFTVAQISRTTTFISSVFSTDYIIDDYMTPMYAIILIITFAMAWISLS